MVNYLNFLQGEHMLILLTQRPFHFLLIRVSEISFPNYILLILDTCILDGATPATPVHVTLTWIKEHKYLIATM